MALLAERGAEVAYHDPHVPAFRDAADEATHFPGPRRGSLPTQRARGRDPHAAIDWDVVYGADLIVDTTNSSRGRVGRSRQVLPAGCGLERTGQAARGPATPRPGPADQPRPEPDRAAAELAGPLPAVSSGRSGGGRRRMR